MPTRRSFLKQLGGGALATAAASAWGQARTAAAGEKPNIIFVLVDDMGWSDLGCYGSEIQTPNLDRLAQQGLRFTQFYNTSKCFPSRACLLTGLYAQQCGMDQRHGAMTNSVTLGEALRTAGYRTYASGKHHGTENLYDRGFDHYYGLRDGCCNFWNPGARRAGEPPPAQKRANRVWCDDAKVFRPFTPKDPKFYTTDAFTDKALKWLDEPECRTQPFFLYLAYTAPHYPLHARPEDIARQKGKYDAGYLAIRKARYARQVKMGLIDPETTPLPDEPGLSEWNKLPADRKAKEIRRMEIYAAMIERVDYNIGRLLDKLKQQGKLKNTFILFASDNGACAEGANAKNRSKNLADFGKVNSYEVVGRRWATVQNTPLRFWKNYSHEGGICTPGIVNWPGHIKDPGSFCREPAHFIDVMSTVLAAAGGKYPETCRGRTVTPTPGISLLPALQGKSLKRPAPLCWKWARGGAVRDGNLKAVYWTRKGKPQWQLYDLAADRTETRDLAAARPAERNALISKWKAWVAAAKAK